MYGAYAVAATMYVAAIIRSNGQKSASSAGGPRFNSGFGGGSGGYSGGGPGSRRASSTARSAAQLLKDRRDVEVSAIKRTFREGHIDAAQKQQFVGAISRRYGRRIAEAVANPS